MTFPSAMIVVAVLFSVSVGTVHALSAGECQMDDQCVPAQCCHPTTCVASFDAPPCASTSCTSNCEAGTMDCGQGRCFCVEGLCRVKMAQVNPLAQPCTTAADCKPSSCCSATSCSAAANAPDCTAANCPAVCRAGSLDCGGGQCACFNGQCGVQWASTTPAPKPTVPLTCQRMSDCVPATCCSATTCVHRLQARDCSATSCIAGCVPGTLDCGQGYCDCSDGVCRGVKGTLLNTLPASPAAAVSITVAAVISLSLLTLMLLAY
jgi:hypothetical protein